MIAIGSIISKVTQYVVLSLCTYLLSTSEYGIADICVSTASLILPLITLDISQAVFRFTDSYNKKGLLSFSTFVTLGGCIICILLTPLLANIPDIGRYWLHIAALMLFEGLFNVFKEYTRGAGLSKEYVVGGIINSLLQIAGCYAFVYICKLGVVGYIYGLSVGYLSESIYLAIRLDFCRNISFSSVRTLEVKELLEYSTPLIPNTVMWWIVSISDRYFILYMVDESSTGLYSVAAKIPALITIVTTIFFKAWEMNSLKNINDYDKAHYDSTVFGYLWFFTVLGVAVLLLVLRIVMSVLVSSNFREAWKYAVILIGASAFSSLQSFFGTYYTISKASLGCLKTTTSMALINLALNYILIRIMGVQGATIATLASYMFVFAYRCIDTRKYMKVTIEYKRFVPSMLIVVLESILLTVATTQYYYIITTISIITISVINIKTFKEIAIRLVKLRSRS